MRQTWPLARQVSQQRATLQGMNDDDNGILSTVPGADIAAAMGTLPDPAAEGPERVEVELELAGAWRGRVRVTFRRYSYKASRSRVWAWSAIRADRVTPD